MVWEQNVAVVVMLTTLADMGLVCNTFRFVYFGFPINGFLLLFSPMQTQSVQYWPTSGVTSFQNYEVFLIV